MTCLSWRAASVRGSLVVASRMNSETARTRSTKERDRFDRSSSRWCLSSHKSVPWTSYFFENRCECLHSCRRRAWSTPAHELSAPGRCLHSRSGTRTKHPPQSDRRRERTRTGTNGTSTALRHRRSVRECGIGSRPRGRHTHPSSRRARMERLPCLSYLTTTDASARSSASACPRQSSACKRSGSPAPSMTCQPRQQSPQRVHSNESFSG